MTTIEHATLSASEKSLDYTTLRSEEDGHEAVLYIQGKHRAAPKGFKFRITGFLAGEGWCVKLGAN